MKNACIRGLKILHFGIIILMFVIAWKMYAEHYAVGMAERYHIFIYVLYGILELFLIRVYNGYMTEYRDVSGLVISQGLASFISILAVYVLTMIAWNKVHPPVYFLILFAAELVFSILWSVLAVRLSRKLGTPLKTVVLYRNKADLKRLKDLDNFRYRFDVSEQVKVEPEENIHDILEKLEKYQAVFVTGINASTRNGIAKYCREKGKLGYYIPHVGDIIVSGGEHVKAFSVPVTGMQRTGLHPEVVIAKRVMDIVIALLLTVITSPFMLVTAIAVKLCDGGPVLYKQERLTKDGKVFKMLKFRSMRTDAEKDGVARLSSGKNDARITPVGRVIRAIRFDELPQVFNILKGDMSLVGPRPERPEIAKQYEEVMPAFRLRLQVKAGLTGYAQVYGKYNTDPYDKLEMDLIYINKMSILTDIELLFATIRILFMKESTEGVEQGKITAMDDE